MKELEFDVQLKQKVQEIEAVLKSYLPEEKGYQKTIFEAMNYSMLAGGKRLRPMLMQETFRMFGGKGEIITPFMAAIEMVHTYSLVHDDLPAMDNDEYRRGRKTTWSVYGEAMGVLAGDALLNFAFETALQAFEIRDERITVERMQAIARALQVFARKAGIYGMIGGQTVDVEAEGKEEILTEEQLMFVHEHKTAALIQSAMMIGAILAGASEWEVEAVEKCAYNVGIAFQIQDDILDVVGDIQELGKPVGSDAQNQKQTYVTIYGLEKAAQEVDRLSREAVAILNGFEGEHAFLEQLLLQLIHRRK